MREFFKNHPIVTYNDRLVRNILLNARITREVLEDNSNFYPYTLSDGEMPTHVAFNYYDSVDYVWLVFFSNNIIDPYTDWYKSQEQFNQYIDKKYGSYFEAQNLTLYYRHPDYDYLMTPDTYDILQNALRGEDGEILEGEDGEVLVAETASDAELEYLNGWEPLKAYDWEVEQNESRRTIQLIDKRYAARLSLELEKKLAA